MISRIAVWLLILSTSVAAGTQPDKSGQLIFPSPAKPTIPADAMFALGQQSGRLDNMEKRLENIERDIKQLTIDVSRVQTIGAVFLLIFTVVVGPIVVYRIQQRMNPVSQRPSD